MFDSCSFTFGGESCEKYGLMMYNIGNDSQSDVSFASDIKVSEDRIIRRYDSLHYGGSQNDQLTFTLVFGAAPELIDKWQYFDRWDFQAISGWLTGHSQYKWLTIEQPDLEGVRYKCMISKLKPISVGGLPWAFSCTVTCDSPFAYTYPDPYPFKVDGEATGFLLNKSTYNGEYRPKLTISLPEGGDFSICNESDGGRAFAFTGMPVASNIVINVDNLNEVITSNLSINLFEHFNLNFFRLVRGDNLLSFTGKGTVTIVCEFPVNVGA